LKGEKKLFPFKAAKDKKKLENTIQEMAGANAPAMESN